MRNQVFLIAAIVLMSGCKVFKSKQYSRLEVRSEIRKDSVGLIIDKSVITIKEKIDTTAIIPEKVIKQDTYLNVDSLVKGMTAIKNDVLDLRLVLNPVTGILSAEATIKALKVPVTLNKEIIKHNNITQQASVVDDRKLSASEVVGSSTVKKEPVGVEYYVVGFFLFGAMVVFVMFWIKRKMQ